jgi:hypothetical protein
MNMCLQAEEKKQRQVTAERYLQEDEHVFITEQQQQLMEGDKRTILGRSVDNSPQFEAVKTALQEVADRAATTIETDESRFARQLAFLTSSYNGVILSCTKYLESHTHTLSGMGKFRKQMITGVLKAAQRERDLLAGKAQDVRTQLLQTAGDHKMSELLGTPWTEVIGAARTETVDVTGQATRTVGAGTSELTVFQHGGQTYYFKDQEVLKAEVTEEMQEFLEKHRADLPAEMAALLPSIDLTTLNRIGDDLLAGKTNEEIWSQVEMDDKSVADECRRIVSPDKFELFKNYCLIFVKNENKKSFCQAAGIKIGDVISMRNYASSRMAGYLGVPMLLAPSKTITLKQGASERIGNAMGEAAGIDCKDLTEDQLSKISAIAPEAIRELMNLQTLDYLSGQIDRHQGNYRVVLQEHTVAGQTTYTITRIIGIDNDLAFGALKSETIRSSGDFKGGAYNNLPTFTRKKTSGELCTMDTMDSDMAMKMLALTDDILDFRFQDLLKPEELVAMHTRLHEMQETIKRTFQSNPNFLRKAEDWGAAGVPGMVSQGKGYAAQLYQRINLVKTKNSLPTLS